MSLQAYQQVLDQAGSERQTQHRALAMITAQLVTARDQALVGAPLVEALHRNRQIWDIFATDCASPGNRLPPPLRAQIISLALFVGRYSSEVAVGKGDIDDLIDINRAIMGGLMPGGVAP